MKKYKDSEGAYLVVEMESGRYVLQRCRDLDREIPE
jgi:hypothetical protein